MRFFQPALVAFAATVAITVSAVPAMASGYTGNWPVTITHSKGSDGTDCLTLTDGGSLGWRHSGYAALRLGNGSKLPYGTFQVINGLLVVTVEAQGYGQNAGLVFIGQASRGSIGKGTYDEVYGGEEFDSGALSFGKRNGC